MVKALDIYHYLPPVARDWAASARGWHLGRRRYGAETDELARTARERETWDSSRWQEWTHSRLSHVLKRAGESVPYYREQWARRRRAGDSRSSLDLKNWPLLPKQDLRKNPKAFLVDDSSRWRLQSEHTSGTTGTPLRLWQSRSATRQWYALMEARWRGWYGVSRQDRWAIIGGQLVTPIEQKTPPFWVWNAGLKQLYFSAYHLSHNTAASYVTALKNHRVAYLWAYPSALSLLAGFARDQRLELPQLKVIISNAEPLIERERQAIAEAFHCPVRNTYGMSEMVAAAGECQHGRLHLWPEAGLVEVLKDDTDEPAGFGEIGRLVCTGLLNEEMPLIRYELGDRGALADPSVLCPCGRTLPILQSVEGRDDDVIMTPEGTRIGRLDPVFKAGFPIREAQVIQETLTSLVVKVVPDAGFNAEWANRIEATLRSRVGAMTISVQPVKEIPRGANGKFRAVISRLNTVSVLSDGTGHVRTVAPRPAAPLSLRMYHSLPPLARDLAATLHGYSLKGARYGPATARLADEALERDSWSASQWKAWTDENMQRVLRRAAVQVPYYRQYWETRRRHGDSASFEILANWPILKKEAVRNHPELFLADDCDPRKMLLEHTSGTTGTPLTLWRSRETNQRWYALYEARIRRWNGVTHEHRWGHVGGQPVVPFHQQAPPYWVWNAALRQLYLSCMHIGPQSSAAYLDAIKKYRLEFLLGYSSSISLLAQYAFENGVETPLKLVITDSEPLLDQQRSIVKRGFACPIRETYGMAEIACAASECSAGALHLWPEVGIIELLNEKDQPVGPGQTGRIIATKLLNPDMPLIRYDTQDLAQAETSTSTCACGRSLPTLHKLLGRNDDVVITRDGRRIVQIDRIFDPCYDIREAQIVQEAIGRFTIKVVPGRRWSLADGVALSQALGDLVGEAEIDVELVSQIEKTWAGKHRMIISKVPPDQRDLAGRTS
jgi:phenylacetate-CoA ligase